MPGSNLDQLTREEKRALLAERLRNQSRLTTSAATLSRGEGSAPQEPNTRGLGSSTVSTLT